MVTAPLWFFKCFRFCSQLYFETSGKVDIHSVRTPPPPCPFSSTISKPPLSPIEWPSFVHSPFALNSRFFLDRAAFSTLPKPWGLSWVFRLFLELLSFSLFHHIYKTSKFILKKLVWIKQQISKLCLFCKMSAGGVTNLQFCFPHFTHHFLR